MDKRKKEEYYIYEPCYIAPRHDLSEEERQGLLVKIREENKKLVEKLKRKYNTD